MKLSLEPGFKRSITNNFTDDAHFEDEFMDHAKKHEFADITWYPSRRTAVYRYDDRVPLNTSGDGINDFLGFQSNSILTSKLLRAAGIYSFVSFISMWYLKFHKHVKLVLIIRETQRKHWKIREA